MFKEESTAKPFYKPTSCLDCPYSITACPHSCVFDPIIFHWKDEEITWSE